MTPFISWGGKRAMWSENYKLLRIKRNLGCGVWTRTTDLGIMRLGSHYFFLDQV